MRVGNRRQSFGALVVALLLAGSCSGGSSPETGAQRQGLYCWASFAVYADGTLSPDLTLRDLVQAADAAVLGRMVGLSRRAGEQYRHMTAATVDVDEVLAGTLGGRDRIRVMLGGPPSGTDLDELVAKCRAAGPAIWLLHDSTSQGLGGTPGDGWYHETIFVEEPPGTLRVHESAFVGAVLEDAGATTIDELAGVIRQMPARS